MNRADLLREALALCHLEPEDGTAALVALSGIPPAITPEDARRIFEELARAPEPRTLTEILTDPDALKPPRAVAPRVAWAHRVTMLAAREKMGKSTFASAVAAAVSRGGFLFGQRCAPGEPGP